jgi:hypothetical protein
MGQARWKAALMADTNLSPLTRLVALSVGEFWNHQTGWTWTSAERFGGLVGVQRNHTFEHLARLVEAGYIHRFQTGKRGGFMLTALTMPPAESSPNVGPSPNVGLVQSPSEGSPIPGHTWSDPGTSTQVPQVPEVHQDQDSRADPPSPDGLAVTHSPYKRRLLPGETVVGTKTRAAR